MAITSKPKQTIVKVMRILKPADQGCEVRIYQRGRSDIRNQFLGGPARAALGSDTFGYFEAERIGETWYLGSRLPHNLGW